MNAVKQCSKEDLPREYLSTLNGVFKLTETEIDLLVEFIKEYIRLSSKGMEANDLNRLLFSPATKKDIYERMNYKYQNFYNKFDSLVSKGIIIGSEKQGYRLAPQVIPSNKIILEFKVI